MDSTPFDRSVSRSVLWLNIVPAFLRAERRTNFDEQYAHVFACAVESIHPEDVQFRKDMLGWIFSIGGVAFDLAIVVPLLLSTELNRTSVSRRRWRCELLSSCRSPNCIVKLKYSWHTSS